MNSTNSNGLGDSMSAAQRGVWAILIAIVIGLLVIRSFIGNGMGKVYVEPKEQSFVQLADTSGDDGKLTAGAWVATDSEKGKARLATAGSPQISWTEYEQVEPKAYFAQEAAGAGGSISLSWARTIGLWLAAFFTFAIYSFLYRDNPLYKFAESVIVGVSAGYWMVVGFWDTLVPNLIQRLAPVFSKSYLTPGMELPSDSAYLSNLWFLIPLVLGVMLLCRLIPKGGWLSLWPLAFIVGTMAGLRMVGYVEGDLLSQARATIIPLYVESAGATPFMTVWMSIWASLANILIVIGVLCCLVYFFFSVEHKGVVGGAARVGIWYLMITFGAAFGFTVMGRIALLAARMEFLFDDWLWLIDPTEQRTIVSAAVGLIF